MKVKFIKLDDEDVPYKCIHPSKKLTGWAVLDSGPILFRYHIDSECSNNMSLAYVLPTYTKADNRLLSMLNNARHDVHRYTIVIKHYAKELTSIGFEL